MKSGAATVEEYLAGLLEDRRAALGTVRKAILNSLPRGYEETMQYGMIAYVVPHCLYPAGYHCNPSDPLPYAMLASQKSHMAVYLMTVYGDPAIEKWFRDAWNASGKKLDMGKSCVRFKKLEDVPLDVIGQVIARVSVSQYIAHVEQVLKGSAAAKRKPEKKETKRKKKGSV